MAARKLRLGIAGLGRAFSLMMPTLVCDERLVIVAGADPRAEARARFEADFAGRAYVSVEAMCADPNIDVVYVSTPHQYHAENVAAAAAHRKHILCEKPMALSVSECLAMIESARQAGVHLLVGHSHSYDGPIRQARRLIETGEFGAVRMLHALDYTDFLYRPRRPEELDTAKGGGIIYNQTPHQVDNVRFMAGGKATSVRAMTGAWDRERGTEGAYAALIRFENGAFANMTYSGYAHFDWPSSSTGSRKAASLSARTITAPRAARSQASPRKANWRSRRNRITAATPTLASIRKIPNFPASAITKISGR